MNLPHNLKESRYDNRSNVIICEKQCTDRDFINAQNMIIIIIIINLMNQANLSMQNTL